MEIVSFDLIKKHVCADDFNADDDLLRHYLMAAQQTIIGRVGRSEIELLEIGEGDYPAALKQAVMLLVGHWYDKREAVATVQMHEIPLGITSLVKPFIKLMQP